MTSQKDLESDMRNHLTLVNKRYGSQNKSWLRYSVLFIGFILILLSYFLNNSMLANISIGMVLIGILFIFIQTEKYVDLNIFISSIIPYYRNYFQLIDSKKYRGVPIYYSTGNLETMVEPVMIIPKDIEIEPISITFEEINNMLNSEFMIITPPGATLMRLIEQEVKKPLMTLDLFTLDETLNKILGYDFRLVESIRIEVKDNYVLVTMKGNQIYEGLFEIVSDERIHNIGDTVSSAIACIITKIKLAPVIIKSYNTISNNIIRVEYEIRENK